VSAVMPGYCFNHFGQRVEVDLRGQVIRAEITVECDVRVPPRREKLLALCNEHKTPSAIKNALENR
jgi:hypothetical protein